MSPAPRGGRVLPLGETVDLIIEEENLEIDVAPQYVQHVVPADRQAVAVTCDDPHVELGIGELDSSGDGRRPPVDRVESVRRQVIREPGRAADPRNEHGALAPRAQLRQGLLDGLEDRVVPAAWTPPDLLVRSV